MITCEDDTHVMWKMEKSGLSENGVIIFFSFRTPISHQHKTQRDIIDRRPLEIDIITRTRTGLTVH